MTLFEIVISGYIGLGMIWLILFQIQKARSDQPADVFWTFALDSLLIQIY